MQITRTLWKTLEYKCWFFGE